MTKQNNIKIVLFIKALVGICSYELLTISLTIF